MVRDSIRRALVMAVLTWGGIASGASTTQPAEGDPAAMKEAEGYLKLVMRVDGETRFVYPSIYEETKNPNPMYIQYKAWEKKGFKGQIDSVVVQVLDKDGNAVWEKNVKQSADWADSGFRTRTNKEGSKDADGRDNKVGDKWKFIDPNSSPFTATLTITLRNGRELKTKPDNLKFMARPRYVFLASSELEAKDRAKAKAWMWKTYGFTAGGKDDAATVASNDNSKLFFFDGPKLSAAIACLTPRGNIYTVGHGGKSLLGVDGNFYPGFKGDASEAGTGMIFTNNPYDVTACANAHWTTVDILHCFSGSVDDNAVCSVAQSYVNSLGTENKKTIAGGGTVQGYTSNVGLAMGEFAWRTGISTTNITPQEYEELSGYAHAAVLAQAVTAGAVDQNLETSPSWINAKSPSNVNPDIDKAAATNAAKQQFDNAHPNHAPYTFAVTVATSDYQLNNASKTATAADVINIPSN